MNFNIKNFALQTFESNGYGIGVEISRFPYSYSIHLQVLNLSILIGFGSHALHSQLWRGIGLD